jgi:hypothetical protein
VRGEYEGQLVAHGSTVGRAAALVREALRDLGRADAPVDEHTYRRGRDITRWDPYLGSAFADFRHVDRATLNRVRAKCAASYVARSARTTDRELSDALLDRAPLRVPTHEMWREALRPRGFGEPPAAWVVEDAFVGGLRLAPPPEEVQAVAFDLMDRENARRASLR